MSVGVIKTFFPKITEKLETSLVMRKTLLHVGISVFILNGSPVKFVF